ncbi:EAL domain-containing protein [uncultured Vibrio sp.]|uniref:EAL domain-containing protein n=1 Tax=uncultured Vibrio sp. TaxID=114054 RepID=UPI0025D0748C|nr:EAL domain-containing protein [uncultured Vibrio sp.]
MLFNRLAIYCKNAVGRHSRAIWLHVIFIYIAIFIVGSVLVKPIAERHIDSVAQHALRVIENEFEQLQDDLQFLTDVDYTSKSCPELTKILRSKVFESDIAKEIGVFRPSGEVYCTSSDLGSSFYLYTTIMERLEKNNTTLSYTKSKMSDMRSAFLFFTGPSKYGVSTVVPPRYLHRVIDFLSEKGTFVDIEVISRNILEREQTEDRLGTFTHQSEAYPLKISIHTFKEYYTDFFLDKLWFGLIISSLLSIYYIYARQKKVAGGTLEGTLKNAIAKCELDVYYQPIVHSKTGAIIGCESLVRWNSPSQGFISPGIFIPLAEKLGLIDQISDYVITNVTSFLTEHIDLFVGRYISINISRSQILRDEFVNRILSELSNRPEIVDKLVFEITEEVNFSVEELDRLKMNLNKISDLGIKIAIDDFGTGYSGLDFIRQYQFDIIKIDRVFVNNLGSDSKILPLLESMRVIAETFQMSVIIEGVEEEKQVDILSELGFFYIQGFYYFRPMPKKELLAVIG